MEWGTEGPLAKHSGTEDAKRVKCIHLTGPLTTPEPAARRRGRHRRCLFWRRANQTPEIYTHISLSQKANGQCAHFLFCQRWNWSAGRLHHSFMGTRKQQPSWACHPGPEGHKSQGFLSSFLSPGFPVAHFLPHLGRKAWIPSRLLSSWWKTDKTYQWVIPEGTATAG